MSDKIHRRDIAFALVFAIIFLLIGMICMYFISEYKYGKMFRDAEIKAAYISGQVSVCKQIIANQVNKEVVIINGIGEN